MLGGITLALLRVSLWFVSACVHDAPETSGQTRSDAETAATVDVAAPPVVAANVKPSVSLPDLPSLQQTCDAICSHSRELKCNHTSQCFSNCVGMGAITPCTDEVSAFYRCLTKQPTRNWQCDEDGVAAIREGLCDTEQSHVVKCMQAKGQ